MKKRLPSIHFPGGDKMATKFSSNHGREREGEREVIKKCVL